MFKTSVIFELFISCRLTLNEMRPQAKKIISAPFSHKKPREIVPLNETISESEEEEVEEEVEEDPMEEDETQESEQEEQVVNVVKKKKSKVLQKPIVASKKIKKTGKLEKKIKKIVKTVNDKTMEVDLSESLNGRLGKTRQFNLGNAYFVRLGPENLHNQPGSYDALKFFKLGESKNNEDPKENGIAFPIRLISKLNDSLNQLHDAYNVDRQDMPSSRELEEYFEKEGEELDLSYISNNAAPKMRYILDSVHRVEGGTIKLPKGNSYEAISFIRGAKTGQNGKPTKQFETSFPIRFLPILKHIVNYANTIA